MISQHTLNDNKTRKQTKFNVETKTVPNVSAMKHKNKNMP